MRLLQFSKPKLFLSLFTMSCLCLSWVALEPRIEEGEIRFSLLTPEKLPKESFNLLHIANFVYSAESGDIETVKKYLELGIDVNAQDHNQDTALMGASLNGHKKIVELLLAYQANPSIENSEGFSALDFSKINGNQGLTSDLVAANISAHKNEDRNISSVDKAP